MDTQYVDKKKHYCGTQKQGKQIKDDFFSHTQSHLPKFGVVETP